MFQNLAEISAGLIKLPNFRPQPKTLKPAPEIYGRADVISKLVTLFTKTEEHAAVYGLGGMGKSSIALNVAHHPIIIKKFPNRLFYPCHTDKSVADLTIGLLRLILQQEPKNESKHDALLEELAKLTTFLVIDNFESVWYDNISEAEKFVAQLAGIPTLTLLITTGTRLDDLDIDRGIEIIHLETIFEEASRSIFLKRQKNARYNNDPSLKILLGDTVLAGYPLAIKIVTTHVANAFSPYNNAEKIIAAWRKSQTNFDGLIHDP